MSGVTKLSDFIDDGTNLYPKFTRNLKSVAGNIESVTLLDNAAFVFVPAFVTGGNGGQQNFATWAAVTDGSFQVTIDGTLREVTGINFTGVLSMTDVATTIQTSLRAVTGSTETVVWSTDHFIVSSVNTTYISAITQFSSSLSGTTIHGGSWMDIGSSGIVTDATGSYSILATDRNLSVTRTGTGTAIINFTSSLPVGTVLDICDTAANCATFNITINRYDTETFVAGTTGNTSLTMNINGQSTTIKKVSSTVWKVM